MPKRIPKKKTTKKRIYKKKYTKKTKVVKPLSNAVLGRGFPMKISTTHIYKEAISPTSTVGAISVHNFISNGMYDPNITGTGHQPMFFDQYSAMYNHYHVIGSKIKVTFLQSAAGNSPVVCGIYLNDDTTTTPTNYQTLGEQTFARQKILTNGGTATQLVLTHSYSAKKTFGAGVMANNSLQGTITSNPSEGSYYTVYIQSLNLADTNTVLAMIEIEYIAVWSELKDFSGS